MTGSGPIEEDVWVEVDLGIVPAGTISIVLTTTSRTTIRFRSRESGPERAAQLLVSSDPTTPPPPSPSPSPPPTPSPPPPGPLTPPIRAAFYYPWFPELWNLGSQFTPEAGYYSSDDPDVAAMHTSQMLGAGIEAGIASWWGQGQKHEDTRIPILLRAAAGTPFRWTLYYEKEGYADPPASELRGDLDYLARRYANDPAYLRVDGRPVIFVYGQSEDPCEVAQRWDAANGGRFHVVLKVSSGWRDCPTQPDDWHQYAPSTRVQTHLPHSFSVSAGFWHANEGWPRLARDPAAVAQAVRDMVASGARWQLVYWNEWGEGTSWEPAVEWDSTYVDILANDGATTPPEPSPSPSPEPSPSPTPPPPAGGSTVFAAVGDVGGEDRDAGVTLSAIASSGADFTALLGDISYDEIRPESAWCDWAFSKLGAGHPLQLVSGNHEEDGGPDGWIMNFVQCAPDRLGAVGTYGAEYYVDTGPVRLIMIAADLDVDGERYRYSPGDRHFLWLRERIREAKDAGKWVVVGMHKVCLSAGNKSCEIGDALMDLLIIEGADLVLQSHDHDYQRFHSLWCADPGSYDPACVADDGNDGAYTRGVGTVFVIVGTGGKGLTSINTGDSEYRYVATWMGGQTGNRGNGFLKVTASGSELQAEFVNATSPGGYRDSFVING